MAVQTCRNRWNPIPLLRDARRGSAATRPARATSREEPLECRSSPMSRNFRASAPCGSGCHSGRGASQTGCCAVHARRWSSHAAALRPKPRRASAPWHPPAAPCVTRHALAQHVFPFIAATTSGRSNLCRRRVQSAAHQLRPTRFSAATADSISRSSIPSPASRRPTCWIMQCCG